MIQNAYNSEADETGGLGGDMPTPKVRTRSQLRFLKKLVEQADQLIEEDQLSATVKFARSVMDDTSASERDRIRASELLNSIIKMGQTAAVESDKMERLDAGDSTENQTVRVEYHEKPLPQRT